MKILLVASDRMEYAGILLHASGAKPERLAADWARSARWNSSEVLLVANGAGPRRAAAAVDAALARFPAEAVVSTGFCGALNDRLRVADIVVANAILAGDRSFPAAVVPICHGAYVGAVCSVDHVVGGAAEKCRLRVGGACAVEMEAAGAAARAAAHRLPFYCVRVVTDLAGETLANDFNAALRSDGHFATMKILREALRHPGARFPELLRLRSRCIRAARVLGDFFADCGF